MTALNELTREQLLALVTKLQAEPARKLTLKVSKRGAVSLYGMGRFPVTLYAGQWERVFAAQDQINAFMAANKALLATGRDDPRYANVSDD